MTREVVVCYNDQPDKVADKFLKAIQQLGLTVKEQEGEDLPNLVFLISNDPPSTQQPETVKEAARREFYGEKR